jgi:hypothetical protein
MISGGRVFKGFVLRYQDISIDDLIVNPENDRHGSTPSENAAIHWLFANKSKEMRKLANRIADAGRVYDSPLVVPNGEEFLVKDGNRRVTCVKLIHTPLLAPDKFRKFFAELNLKCAEKLSKSLTCQIELETDVADEIVGLRHNGTQDGEGQVIWGNREKANHANRINGKSDYSWAQKVETYLSESGYQQEALSIKRSNLDKILDTKSRRNRFGISEGQDGKLSSKHSKADTLKLLLKLVSDMNNGGLTLKDLLTSADKNKYIDILSSKGFLPDVKPVTPTSPPKSKKPKGKKKQNPAPPKPPTEPNIRDTLIPTHVRFDFDWNSGQNKISYVWDQLQYYLEFDRNKFAIVVLFRVLLDLTAQNYCSKNELKTKGTLAKDLKQVSEGLMNRGMLASKEHLDICKVFDDKNASISIENLQRALHSKSHIPSIDDMVSMWDCLEPFMCHALKSSQSQSPRSP